LRREHRETERERALSARLSTLNDLFQQLSASLDPDQTMQTVVGAPRHLLGADVTVILLRREDRRGLYLAASSGLELDSPFHELPLDEELVERVLNMGAPYVVEDLATQPAPLRSLLEMGGVLSLAAVALILDEQTMGVLCAGRRTSTAFSEDDLAFLNALAQEAALAIRNARLYERERQQVKELQALEALQATFVSVVSHELRTPLTCIKASVDMLEDTEPRDVPEVRRELVQTIVHHTGRLEALVKDLLDATRLEAGQLTLSLQPTDLRLLVEKTVRAFAPLVEKKEQVIELELPKTIGAVTLDRHRIEQILTNLISNAHRFTPKRGHIRVSLSEAEEYLELTVNDDGAGIPLEEQDRIFEKFYVVADGRGLAGVGLGLYITRQLVELHGGRIWVESTLGKGSTFLVTIPKEGKASYSEVESVEGHDDPKII